MEGLLQRFEGKVYINNEYVKCQSSERLTVKNPANDAIFSERVANANMVDLDVAVAAAEAAFKKGSLWRNMTAAQRSQLLWKLADLVLEPEHAEAMALLDAHCFGRPIDGSLQIDVQATASMLRYYAGWTDKFAGDSYPADDGYYKVVRHEPFGITAAIAAWNGPIASVVMKAGPALATGNVLIFKPSEKTPLSALYFADLFRLAGFPPGVFQVLPGDGSLGGLMAANMKIRKISFTGSVATGKKVQVAAAQSNLKRVTLELGGKSPLIVFEDADLDLAAGWAANTIASNCGQYCIASSRVYVQATVYDAFLEKYQGTLKAIAQGKGVPSEHKTSYGPVGDRQQFERIMAFIDAGKSEAKLSLGGERMGTEGLYIHPTVFIEPHPEAKVYKEEIFGPVAVVRNFETEAEALALSNDTEFGLMAGIFTKDLGLASRVASDLESGTVCINSMSMINNQTPFGGAKQSGYGSEFGRESLMSWTQTKTILIASGG